MSLPPLVKGGQGRTDADVKQTAAGVVWSWLIIAALMCALWGASQ